MATATTIKLLPIRPWLIQDVWKSPWNALTTVFLTVCIAWVGWRLLTWGLINAEFGTDPQRCKASSGACWGALIERGQTVLFGRFPVHEAWRPLLGMLLLAIAIGVAALPRYFNLKGLLIVVTGVSGFGLLMRGGFAGLSVVTSDLWGGLPLTLFLAVIACFVGIPLGILLALGRRSDMPVVRWLCITYIETIRAIPLVTLLFFGAVVLPLMLPSDVRWDTMVRIAWCLIAFEAAYFAEVIRGGLQAIPKGQYEASHALGLNPLKTIRLIVLPQALRITIPPTINNVIGVIKNTSLVAVVNVFDLTGSLKIALADPKWKLFHIEFYVFVCVIYLILGYTIAAYGRYLERKYAMGKA
jgi:general L-amino acid transport system permease protein